MLAQKAEGEQDFWSRHVREASLNSAVDAVPGSSAMTQPTLQESMSDSGVEQTQLLWALFESSQDAIIAKSLDGIIQTWNPGAQKMYGYSPGEAIGRPMTMLCPAGQKKEIGEILAKVVRGERVSHYQTVRQRKDGTTFAASVTSSPVRNAGGKVIGAASTAQDMTEPNRVRAAAALLERAHDVELANENLTSFTAAVSHGLRDSLRVLSGYSEALLEEYSHRLGGEGRGYAERIAAASNDMSALIEDMLRLSRLARAEVDLQVVDLGAQAALIADGLQREQPGRSVRFVIQRPVRACADAVLIQVALQNLMENAWKFTAGQAGASIEFGTIPAGDDAVCCYIRDNGAGFDPASADNLFRPFQRLHTTDEFSGTGVGLASVKQIVGRHQGRAWAEGALGKGATFYFTLNAEEEVATAS
jgi:PAS domain S-box-containing protein